MEAYKIRNKKTGLYSLGGQDAHESQYVWGSIGKIWTSMQALRLHLRQYKKQQIADWEVHRVATGDRTTVIVSAESLYELKSKFVVKFSETLTALLRYSCREHIDTSWTSLRDEFLGDLYHSDMSSSDVLAVVTQAFNEAKEIQEFKMGTSAYNMFDLLDYPRCKLARHQIMGIPTLFTLEFSVNAYLEFMINQLRFANKAWCKQQLT